MKISGQMMFFCDDGKQGFAAVKRYGYAPRFGLGFRLWIAYFRLRKGSESL